MTHSEKKGEIVLNIKEAQKIIHAGLAWASWTDEQQAAMKVALQAMVDVERIEKENKPEYRQYAECEDCDYQTGNMSEKDLVYKICMDGGYVQSDKDGGYYSHCPKCESSNLSLYHG